MLQEPLSVSGGSRYIPSQVGSHISISSTMAITRANTSLGHSDTACLLDLGECWPSAPSALLSIAATLTCPMPDRPSLRAGIARRPPKHDAVMSSLAHARHTEPATTPAPDSLERGVNAVEVVAHAGPTLETVSGDDHTSDVARQRTSVVVGHLRSGGIGHSPCLQTFPTNRASASVRVLNGPARGVRTRSALSSCSRSCTTYQPAPPSGVHFAAEPGCGVRRCAYTISGRTLGILWLHRQLPNAGVQTRYHTTIPKSVRSAPFDSLGRQARECTDDAISALRRTLPPAHARTIGASGRSVRDMRGRHHFSCHARSARYERASRQKRTPVALRTGALNHPNVGSARILSIIQPLNPSADLVAFVNVTGLE